MHSGEQAVTDSKSDTLQELSQRESYRLARLLQDLQDPTAVESCKVWLLVCAAITIFSLLPLFLRGEPFFHTRWKLAVAGSGVLHAIYLTWALLSPDWSTLRAIGVIYGVTAAGYLAVASWIGFGGEAVRQMLHVTADRYKAVDWCAALGLLFAMAAFLVFWAAARWRRRWSLQARLLLSRLSDSEKPAE